MPEQEDSPVALVRSTVEPDVQLLLISRSILQHDEELKALFVQCRQEQRPVAWLRDMIAPRLATQLDADSFEQVVEVCQYLADEYHQLAEGVLIVSTETGRATMVVGEADLYDPGVLPRDSGRQGQALLRIDPQREMAYSLYQGDREREGYALQVLTQRAHQTPLLKQEGDRRLRVATRTGRSAIAQELAEDAPQALVRRAGGTSGMFLRHFPLRSRLEEPPVRMRCIDGGAICRSTMSIQDMSTYNLGYDRLGVLRAIAPQAWLRDIARELSYAVREATPGRMATHAADVDIDLVRSRELWVTDPNAYAFFRGGAVMPVEGAETIGLSGVAGHLVLEEEFAVETREISDRWEIVATLGYKLYVDSERVTFLPLVGVAQAAEFEPEYFG